MITLWRVASEVLPMEWRQIDFKGDEIRLDPGATKNKQGPVFPMNADLQRILAARKALREDGQKLVSTRKGDPIVSITRRSGRRAGRPASATGSCTTDQIG